jgi:TonB family protein
MIVIGPDGLVSGAEVMKSVGYGLDEKAVEAVRQWKFTPSTRNGVPVAVYVSVLMNFSLRDGPRRTADSPESCQCADGCCTTIYGAMLAFNRNRFVGSYTRFTRRNRS